MMPRPDARPASRRTCGSLPHASTATPASRRSIRSCCSRSRRWDTCTESCRSGGRSRTLADLDLSLVRRLRLDKAIPDHSVLPKAWRRLSPIVYEAFFTDSRTLRRLTRGSPQRRSSAGAPRLHGMSRRGGFRDSISFRGPPIPTHCWNKASSTSPTAGCVNAYVCSDAATT